MLYVLLLVCQWIELPPLREESGMKLLRYMIGAVAAVLLTMTATTAIAEDAANAAPVIKIETKYGVITILTLPDVAPVTVARITELASSGFYDGVVFHRVVPGFVVQGGDPDGNGRGGSGQKLKAEFSDLKHEYGSVSMARSASPDSADSQFYISLGKHPYLDGKYTIFGQVTDGMKWVERIMAGDPMTRVTVE
jgi:cyclophilin family peptidyl-prolyl cis-trans isomerase